MKTLILGSAIIDIIMEIPTLPKKGDDILCSANSSSVGGCAYNVSSVFRSLNLEHDLFVPIGNGVYSEIIKNELNKFDYKILTSNNEKDNGFCICLVENDGERSFVTVNGAESEFKKEWFAELNMSEYEYIYVCGYQTQGESGKIISSWLTTNKDKTIFYAPGPMFSSTNKDIIDEIFSCKPIIHLNEKEINEFFNCNCNTTLENTKAAITNLYKLTNNIVIVTLGENGALYYDGNFSHIKACPSEVMDTIGAGDSHIGTIIASLSMGYDMQTALNYASKVASCVVANSGPLVSNEIINKCFVTEF